MPKLYTIGHSNRTLEEFLELLKDNQIDCIVDVRTVPKSRHVPWFNKISLNNSLNKQKIFYIHKPELGGLRHPNKDSINMGWRNSGFRGFADYMQTPEFFGALKDLNKLIKTKNRVAIMCAEAVPWRCHRSLIADAETVRNIKVLDIIGKTKPHIHKLTTFAVVDKTKRPIKIYYPSPGTLPLDL